MLETWRPVPNIDGYEASTFGRIRSLDRTVTYSNGAKHFHRGRVLKPQANSHGYHHVEIADRTICIHMLVAWTFLPPQPSLSHELAHWDGDKTNNAPSNLRWATKVENQADRIRHGTTNRGERHGAAVLTELDVADCREARRSGVTLAALARRHGVTLQAIHYATTGKNWRHAA